MWLIMWSASWIMAIQYLWYAVSLMLYLSQIVNKYDYRENPNMVLRLGLTKKFTAKIFAITFMYIPYLTIKFIYQIFFEPWTSDEIVNTIALVMFLVILIAPVMMINADLKNEQAELVQKAENIGMFALTEQVQRANSGEPVDVNDAVTALLYHSYLQDQNSKNAEQQQQTGKMVKSAVGPAGSYVSKQGASMLRTPGSIIPGTNL